VVIEYNGVCVESTVQCVVKRERYSEGNGEVFAIVGNYTLIPNKL
jgi:hypothetical protein